MIACERADLTINLYYSVIKFLSFKGVVWSGDRLPLVVNSLGECAISKVELVDQNGQKQKPLWERGILFGRFEPGNLYNINMRLEYHLPMSTEVFLADFQSIHPKSYAFGLDFSTSSYAGDSHVLCLRHGETERHFDLEESGAWDLPSGHHFSITRERDYCSATVSKTVATPFAHGRFPAFSLINKPA